MELAPWLRLLLAVLVIGLAFAFIAEPVMAQSSGFDKDIATKKGVSESLGNKKFDEKKLPSKFKMGVGVGSIFVMIAVVKWL